MRARSPAAPCCPVDGSQAWRDVAKIEALIDKSVQNTYPGLATSDYAIKYRCLIGTGAGDPGAFDTTDIDVFIPLDCDPSHALGHSPPIPSDFIGAGKTRSTDCRPDLGDRCNVVVVDGNVTTGYTFARVVGREQRQHRRRHLVGLSRTLRRTARGQLRRRSHDRHLRQHGGRATQSPARPACTGRSRRPTSCLTRSRPRAGSTRSGLVRYSGQRDRSECRPRSCRRSPRTSPPSGRPSARSSAPATRR